MSCFLICSTSLLNTRQDAPSTSKISISPQDSGGLQSPFPPLQVRIDPSFTSVMMAIMVIEGLGRSLDPNLDILSHAHSCVLHRVKQSARERVSNRLREIQMA